MSGALCVHHKSKEVSREVEGGVARRHDSSLYEPHHMDGSISTTSSSTYAAGKSKSKNLQFAHYFL